MDNFQIETAQNIAIQQKVAGIGDRILAFIVDTAIIVIYSILLAIALSGMGLKDNNLMVYYLIIGLPVFLYYILWETFYNGQTPGKKILEIRVVRLDGSRPTFPQFIIRWLLRLIDISLASGSVAVVTILLNGKGQRLGDIAAGTTVISEKKKIGLADTLLVDVPENYTPKYPQVTVLKDRDVQKIKNLYQKAHRNGNHNVIISLADKVAKLIEVSPEERPAQFLQTVLSDYNYFTMQ